MKKIIGLLLVVCTLFAFVSCDIISDIIGGTNNAGKNTLVMEAEYTNLDGLQGGGFSNSADGVDMIIGNGAADESKGWSNGYYVGSTYAEGLTFTFEFNSSAAASATIVLRLASEFGDVTFDSNSFGVKLNGEVVEYSNMFIPASSSADNLTFNDRAISTNANLVEGKNVITLQVFGNTLREGSLGAPMIDCIKVTAEAELTWTPKTENPGNRGGIGDLD